MIKFEINQTQQTHTKAMNNKYFELVSCLDLSFILDISALSVI